MEKVQKPSNSECDAPSSEPFTIYHLARLNMNLSVNLTCERNLNVYNLAALSEDSVHRAKVTAYTTVKYPWFRRFILIMRSPSVKENTPNRSTQVDTCTHIITLLAPSLLFVYLEHRIRFTEHRICVAYIGATFSKYFLLS
jgi:hypothetical protein